LYALLTVLLLSSRGGKFPERFIDFLAFAAEIKQIVYKFILKRRTTFGTHKPSQLPFNGDYSNRFSTILQTSKGVYHEAHLILYRENAFSILGNSDGLTPFINTPFDTATDALCQLKDLTVHIVRLQGLKRSIWKALCKLELDMLTLDFGNDGQPSITNGPGIEDPMLAIAQMLHLTKMLPEAELRPIIINAKMVVRYQSNRTQETKAHKAFARAVSDTGTSGRCPKAKKILLKGGLTATQLGDLPCDATYLVPGWYLKEVEDEDKDTENKENEPEKKTFVWLKQDEVSGGRAGITADTVTSD
jgi:hypothetical protein